MDEFEFLDAYVNSMRSARQRRSTRSTDAADLLKERALRNKSKSSSGGSSGGFSVSNAGPGTFVRDSRSPYHGSFSYGAMPYDIDAYNKKATEYQKSIDPNWDPNTYAAGVSGTEKWTAGKDSWENAPTAAFNPGTAMALGVPVNMDLLKESIQRRSPNMNKEMVDLRANFRALRPIFGANRRAGNVAPGTHLMRDIVLGGRSWAEASGAGDGGGSYSPQIVNNSSGAGREVRARRR